VTISSSTPSTNFRPALVSLRQLLRPSEEHVEDFSRPALMQADTVRDVAAWDFPRHAWMSPTLTSTDVCSASATVRRMHVEIPG